MNELPNDPAMLLSFVNTKLRDIYPSLEALCDDLHVDINQLTDKLKSAGFEYSPENNKFW